LKENIPYIESHITWPLLLGFDEDSTQPGLLTVDWTMDWILDSIMDPILYLDKSRVPSPGPFMTRFGTKMPLSGDQKGFVL